MRADISLPRAATRVRVRPSARNFWKLSDSLSAYVYSHQLYVLPLVVAALVTRGQQRRQPLEEEGQLPRANTESESELLDERRRGPRSRRQSSETCAGTISSFCLPARASIIRVASTRWCRDGVARRVRNPLHRVMPDAGKSQGRNGIRAPRAAPFYCVVAVPGTSMERALPPNSSRLS